MYTLEDQIDNVGRGWQYLCKIADAYIKENYPDYRITQIKEKFGGLRFYYSLPPDDDAGCQEGEQVSRIVQAIETLSYVICETCGAPGSLRSIGYWQLTRCDEHYDEAVEARKWRWDS